MSDTLFDVGASPATRRNQAADATRLLPTCWHYCGHATMRVHTEPHKNEAKRSFKLCYLKRDEPRRIYPSDTVCDFHIERVKTDPPKPATRGWEDY
jgi:hypothetical protein